MPTETQPPDAILALIPEILRRPGSLIETFSDDRIVIRRSSAARLLLSVVVGACILFACGFVAIAFVSRSGTDKAPIGFSLFMVVLAVLFGSGAILALPQAGPLRLECDLRQGTYRFTRSTPAIRTTIGAFTDFASVSVQSYQTASRGGSIAYEHRVVLTWKVAPLVFGRPSPTVIAYVALGPDDADAMARALSARLGLSSAASRTP